jgi:hypothetical protein
MRDEIKTISGLVVTVLGGVNLSYPFVKMSKYAVVL